MNTKASDEFVADWKRRTPSLKRGSMRLERTFEIGAVPLFRLLCPTTELDWLPGWKCELLHSESGYSEYNVIFRTDFFGADEVWVCTRYEPGKAIEYARSSADFCAKLGAGLVDNCNGTVTVSWAATVSALTPAGNEAVDNLEAGREHLKVCIDQLEHYVKTGEMAS